MNKPFSFIHRKWFLYSIHSYIYGVVGRIRGYREERPVNLDDGSTLSQIEFAFGALIPHDPGTIKW